MRIEQVLVRHQAIALDAPTRAPRVPDDEGPLRIVISDGYNTVASHHSLAGVWHRDNAGLRYRVAFKALVDRKSEHKRITFREASLHLRKILGDASIRGNKVQLSVGVGGRRGLLTIFLNNVGPVRFGRSPEGGDGFDPVTDLSAAVLTYSTFHNPLIVVDEQARWREILRALLALIEFDGSRDAVARTAAQLPLIVD